LQDNHSSQGIEYFRSFKSLFKRVSASCSLCRIADTVVVSFPLIGVQLHEVTSHVHSISDNAEARQCVNYELKPVIHLSPGHGNAGSELRAFERILKVMQYNMRLNYCDPVMGYGGNNAVRVQP
jgi:hypothetical protein